MTLSLCGPQPLDELEALARRLFEGVPNTRAADVEFPAAAFTSLPHLQCAGGDQRRSRA